MPSLFSSCPYILLGILPRPQHAWCWYKCHTPFFFVLQAMRSLTGVSLLREGKYLFELQFSSGICYFAAELGMTLMLGVFWTRRTVTAGDAFYLIWALMGCGVLFGYIAFGSDRNKPYACLTRAAASSIYPVVGISQHSSRRALLWSHHCQLSNSEKMMGSICISRLNEKLWLVICNKESEVERSVPLTGCWFGVG